MEEEWRETGGTVEEDQLYPRRTLGEDLRKPCHVPRRQGLVIGYSLSVNGLVKALIVIS